MTDSFIIDSIRTPIGNLCGGLAHVRADDQAAIPLAELIRRNPQVPPHAVDDVIIGCHNQAGEDNRNVARMALLLAGIPYTVPGETINRLCASGMSAVIHAHRAIQAGDAHLMVVGGIEHMNRGPYVLSKTSRAFGNDAKMYDSSIGWRFVNHRMEEKYGVDAMGMTAEHLAEYYHIHRADQDMFAYRSQCKAAAAQQTGILAEEIIPVHIAHKKGPDTIFGEWLLPHSPEQHGYLVPDLQTVYPWRNSDLFLLLHTQGVGRRNIMWAEIVIYPTEYVCVFPFFLTL